MTMTTPPTPAPGEIWRHYEGGQQCHVLGVATEAKPLEVPGVRLFTVARFADTMSPVKVWHTPADELRVISSIVGDRLRAPLAIYVCAGRIWACSPEEFLDKFTPVTFDNLPR